MDSLEQSADEVGARNSHVSQLRDEIRADVSAARTEVREIYEATLREMRRLNAETRAYKLVSHEEVLSRLALLDERLNGRQRSRGTSGRSNRKPRSKKG